MYKCETTVCSRESPLHAQCAKARPNNIATPPEQAIANLRHDISDEKVSILDERVSILDEKVVMVVMMNIKFRRR
jgi:hypothetical protein